jgi:hypothetical protein
MVTSPNIWLALLHSNDEAFEAFKGIKISSYKLYALTVVASSHPMNSQTTVNSWGLSVSSRHPNRMEWLKAEIKQLSVGQGVC